MKNLLRKLFKYLYQNEIKVWYDPMFEKEDIVISISDYTKASMPERDITALKYHLNAIKAILN